MSSSRAKGHLTSPRPLIASQVNQSNTTTVINLCSDDEDGVSDKGKSSSSSLKDNALKDLHSTVDGAFRLFAATLDLHHARELVVAQRALRRGEGEAKTHRTSRPAAETDERAPDTSTVTGKRPRSRSQESAASGEIEAMIYDDIVSELLCTVCRSRLPTHVLSPCGHCICGPCIYFDLQRQMLLATQNGDEFQPACRVCAGIIVQAPVPMDLASRAFSKFAGRCKRNRMALAPVADFPYSDPWTEFQNAYPAWAAWQSAAEE